MDAMELLLARRSVSKLREPAPPAEVRKRVYEAALRTPDHGALVPWRVLEVEGGGRDALATIFRDALAKRDPSADAATLEREGEKAKRAPLILVVGCAVRESAKIPELEQIASASAFVQTLLIGFQAEGFGAVWKTGQAAFDPHVKEALGFAARDHILAFLWVGTGDAPPDDKPRPGVERVFEVFPPKT